MTHKRDHLIMLCTGNVCRSPMAAKLIQHALDAEGSPLNEISVISAGVAAGYGEPASSNSVRALKKVNLDLSQHQSQPITADLLERAFAVFGMTHSHLDVLQAYYPEIKTRLHLFREFIGGDADIEIPDPFGGPLPLYSDCLDSMVEAVPSLVAYLKREYKAQ